jgi:hypothetical protein
MANRGSFRKGEKKPNQGKRGPGKAETLREMILRALDEQEGGGVAYLKLQAASNPNAFLSLLGKVLPTTLAGDPNNPVRVERIEVVIVDPKA